MIEPARLRELMEARGISQSELARRAGTTQSTIYKLLTGESRSSKYSLRIARELHTTPAYLHNETDDSTADALCTRPLSSGARELVECFDALAADEQRALLQVARSMAGRS